MYKQPENNNKVKYMRTKFEKLNSSNKTNDTVKKTVSTNDNMTNLSQCDKSNDRLKYGNDIFNNNKSKHSQKLNHSDNQSLNLVTSGTNGNCINKVETAAPLLGLTRQLSDPSKKGNIKRTPAFRKDKLLNSRIKVEPHDNTNSDNTVKVFEDSRDICDNTSNNKIESVKSVNFPIATSVNENKYSSSRKAKLVSALSLELDKQMKKANFHPTSKTTSNSKNSLQSQIPKTNSTSHIKDASMQNVNAVKRKSLELMKEVMAQNDLKQTESKQIPEYAQVIKPKKRDSVQLLNPGIQLTDTLRAALKQPLPSGPPPQKPPRAFLNSPDKSKHIENKLIENEKVKLKSDPKLMLQKLENALLNNKIRSPKLPGKLKSSPEFNKKEQLSQSTFYSSDPLQVPCEPNMYTLPAQKTTFPGCLTSFNCLSSSDSYSQIQPTKDVKSTFFIDCKKKSEEPIYAEPYEPGLYSEISNMETMPLIRNGHSLHYMSNPVPEQGSAAEPDGQLLTGGSAQPLLDQYAIIMNHTYSSPTPSDSDVDSCASTPTEDDRPQLQKRNTIRDIVSSFERKLLEKENKIHVPLNTSTNNTSTKSNLKWSENSSSNQNEFKKKNKNETSRNLTEIRKTYVRRICSTLKKPRHKFCVDSPHLFECCLLIGLNVNCETPTPYVKNKYPPNIEPPPHIELLCFPDASQWSLSSGKTSQCFSIVITNEKGERKHGYCRRVLPEEAAFCLPLTYCILSNVRASGFFQKVLAELESRHGLPYGLQNSFLQKLYCTTFPKPGENLHVKCTLRSLVIDSCETMLSKGDQEQKHQVLDSLCHLHNCRSRDNSENSDVADWVVIDKKEKDNSFQVPKNTYGVLRRDNNCDSNVKSFKKINRYSKEFHRTSCNNEELETVDDSEKSGECVRQVCKCSVQSIINEKEENKHSSELLNLPNSQLIHDCLLGDVQIKRPIDIRLEDNDLTVLFEAVSAHVLLEIFGSLLLERKVVFISSSLCKLSSSIEALESILYPFSWHHTFIPILPGDMMEILTTPVPLIAGVLSYHLAHQEPLIVEEGILVNIDKNEVVCSMGDEAGILPKRLRNGLQVGLQLVMTGSDTQDSSRNVLISEAFIRMFLEACGSYRDYISADEKGVKSFKKESFVKHHTSKSINLFLEWFVETAMFQYFINSKLESEPLDNLFDRRFEAYLTSTSHKNTKGIKKVLKLW